jgi:hypothetical protein
MPKELIPENGIYTLSIGLVDTKEQMNFDKLWGNIDTSNVRL